MKKNNNAFTIVELIVVISILSILSTIWFLSYSGYLIWVRDTNRLSQLESFDKWLNTLRTHWRLPLPDTKVSIKSWSEIIAYQWVVWKNILSALDYSNDWLDPKDNTPYSYYITANRKYFQVMWLLESSDSLALWTINNTYAAIDYTNRIPAVKGSKLWILVTDANQPISELWLSPSEINIDNVSNLPLKSYLTSNEFVSWTWTTFAELKNIARLWWRYYSVVWNTFVYTEPN